MTINVTAIQAIKWSMVNVKNYSSGKALTPVKSKQKAHRWAVFIST